MRKGNEKPWRISERIKRIFSYKLVLIGLIALILMLNLARAISNEPQIINAKVDPLKVQPGEVLITTVEFKDDYGIVSAVASYEHESGTDEIPMSLINGDKLEGTYKAAWVVHNTKVKKYYTTVYLTNKLGLTSMKKLEWWDPEVGHNASAISAGNFDPGNFTFQDDLYINDRLGIGTTDPQQELNVIGGLNVTQGLNLSMYQSCTALETDAAGNVLCGTDDGGGSMDYTNIAMTNDTNTFSENQTFSSDIWVSDRLGIGLTNPNSSLHVKDEVTIGDRPNDAAELNVATSSSNIVRFENTGTSMARGNWLWLFQDYGNSSDDTGTGFRIVNNRPTTSTGNALYIDTKGIDLAIKDNGRLGLGTGTADPAASIEIRDYAGIPAILLNTTGTGGMATITFAAAPSGPIATVGAISMAYGAVPEYRDKWVVQTYQHSIAFAAFGTTANDSIQFYTGGRAAENRRMTIDETGNIGIGTTNPQQTLNVVGELNVTQGLNLSMYQSCTALETDAAGNVLCGSDDGGTILDGSLNSTAWNKTGTNVFLADPDDKVGIGTDTPSTLLHVYTASPNDAITTIETNGTGNQARIDLTNSGDSVTWSLKHYANNQFAIQKDGADKVTIDSSGRVGINQTNPSGLLHINVSDFIIKDGKVGINTANPTTQIHIINNSNADVMTIEIDKSVDALVVKQDGSEIGGIGSSGAAGQLAFKTVEGKNLRFQKPGQIFMEIASNGEIGINTTSPDAELHIVGSGSNDAFRVDDSGTDGDTTPFIIDSSGKVGIGTTTPQQELNVIGGLNVTQGLNLSMYQSCTALETDPAGNVLCGSDDGGGSMDYTGILMSNETDNINDTHIDLTLVTLADFTNDVGFILSTNVAYINESNTFTPYQIFSVAPQFTNLTSCDTLDTDSAGNLKCGSDADTGMDYTNIAMTNDTNSFTLNVTFDDEVELKSGVNLSSFTSCTALETDAEGNLVCGSDEGGSMDYTNIALTNITNTFAQDQTFSGDIQVSGNEIKSSSSNVAITLSDNDITIADDLIVTGDLGIGTTTPSNKLDIVGTANVTQDLKVGMNLTVGDGQINSTGTSDIIIDPAGGDVIIRLG